MSTPDQPCQATPACDLRQQIIDSRVPKNEREWWASREIEKLERELAAAKAECDLNRTRLASIFWSGAMDKFTGGDVQKWAADYTAELTAAKAECDRLRFLAGPSAMSDDSIVSAYAELTRLRAEVERLKGALALGQQNCDDAYDDLREERDEAIARAEKAEAALAAMKGTP